MPTLTSETHTNQFYNYKISNLPGRVTGIEVEITTAHVPLSGTLVENKPNHLQFTPKSGRPSPLLDKDSQGYGIIGCVATNGVPNAYRYLCMEPECRGTVFTRLHDLKRHHLDRHIPVRQGFWCLLSECDRSCGSAKPFKRQEDRDNHVLEVHGHLFNQSLKKPLDAAQHIPIPETAQELSLHNWKDLLPTMPEDISDNLELGESPGAGLVWSCTPSNGVSCNDIPLTILDRPVVIPVEHHSLASAYTMPPPDPHRHRFVDASKAIDEDTVNQVFNTYEGILGFYLLINGMLQLIVPDDFDHEYALSHRPNEFGGLRVSYIAQSMTPTADVAVAEPLVQSEDSSVTASVHSQKADISRTPTLSPQSTTMSSTAGSLEIGSTVQAVVEGSKMRDRYQAKIGLMTMSKGQHFLVVPSHMLTQALGASKTKAFPGNNWKDAVTVRACNGDQKLGQVAETFDPCAQTFPHGFLHDVSLVNVSSAPLHLVFGIKSPICTTWLSQAGWNNIKYTSQSLFLLDNPSLETKSIGIMGSQCQMVGQAVFKVREKVEKKSRRRLSFTTKKPDQSTDVETWTGVISRSILYRTNSAMKVPGALSGSAICIHDESGDNVSCAQVAGFSSWAQPVSDVTRFDLDDKKIYNRLEEGRVAFYGAFQAPPKLRDEHNIV